MIGLAPLNAVRACMGRGAAQVRWGCCALLVLVAAAAAAAQGGGSGGHAQPNDHFRDEGVENRGQQPGLAAAAATTCLSDSTCLRVWPASLKIMESNFPKSVHASV